MNKIISDIFKKYDVSQWGVCDFTATLPLIDCRAKSRIPENPKSIIVCLFPYYVGENENRNLSRYAVVSDYHKVAGEILKSVCDELRENFNADFEPFVDSSPIREITAAVLSGVGYVGKNSLLINEKYGSYVFIAEIVTNHYIEPTPPSTLSCIGCNACEKNCVGGAIKDGKVDVTKCASFVSQKKGELSESEKDLIRKTNLVWGCDRCSDVCPHNKTPEKTPIKAFYENVVWSFEEDMNDEFISSRAWGWRGRKVLERNLLIIKEKTNGISK